MSIRPPRASPVYLESGKSTRRRSRKHARRPCQAQLSLSEWSRVTELGPRIWIVSADQWPRAYLRAELIERGYDAVGFVTMKDALLRLMLARSRRPALLVVDLHGQEVNEKMGATLFREPVPLLIVADAGYREDERLG